MKAFVFPGQGAQFVGMGRDLYEKHPLAKAYFDKADEILGFSITQTMFEGTDEALKQTRVTQPAVFLHSVITALSLGDAFQPDMVAGHSLGEFSALVAAGALSFEEGLTLVSRRAEAMQKACEAAPGTMAAIIALADDTVKQVCSEVSKDHGVCVPANFNCPGQIVISGEVAAVEAACEKLKEAGAKRALMLSVGGAFHSPLMEPAKVELEAAINAATFSTPRCPVYQNVSGQATTDTAIIKENIARQLTAPVLWTTEVQNMIVAGAKTFVECGPGKVLQGLIAKIGKGADVSVCSAAETL